MGERAAKAEKRIPVLVWGTKKPKDGEDYTWFRIRGGFRRIAKGEPPSDLFPPDVGPLITEKERDRVLTGTGSRAAHIAQAEEDRENANS